MSHDTDMTDVDDAPPPLALPFLSKETFAVAVAGLIAQLDACAADLRYAIKESPYDPSDIYLEITRSIDFAPSSDTAATSVATTDETSTLDEDDPEALPVQSQNHNLVIHYHILLSPIYAVPTLHLTTNPPIHALSSFYDSLVPPDQRAAVAAVGVQGGISQTEHPYLQRTCWFVHPCQTAEAMRPWVTRDGGEGGRGSGEVGVEGYLGIWLGIVGRAVGLTVPLRRGGQIA
ncbi:Ubiquitin-like-specific protease [Drechslerella dactyloides]|uniref:Ubiquitin-like-conjugating enzyme ATG10 n=1 Tax=Drechslerella dactyloides TaxID=74499 RepID=A0AAD6J6X8_DREDA|nr:Ubiquitin-like-specific protease [Drechslerella dactyloides]